MGERPLTELEARWLWFIETGDMKQWAGPDATVDTLRDEVRKDARALLDALAARDAEVARLRADRDDYSDRHRELAMYVFEKLGAGATGPETPMQTVDRTCAEVARLTMERDDEKKRAEWAIEKLRDMNHRAREWGRQWSAASCRSAVRPAEPLHPKRPESVMAWLRFLIHKVRSQAGEVRAYGRARSQAQVAAAVVGDGGAYVPPPDHAAPDGSGRVARGHVHTPPEGVRLEEPMAVATTPEARGCQACSSGIPCARCGGEVVEFTVPNEVWNRVIRKGGREGDGEYLCAMCFGREVGREVERLTRRTEELEAAAGEWGVEQDRRHRIAIEGMDHLLREKGFSDNDRERVVAFMCGLLPLQRPLTEAEKDYALTLRPAGAAPTEGAES